METALESFDFLNYSDLDEEEEEEQQQEDAIEEQRDKHEEDQSKTEEGKIEEEQKNVENLYSGGRSVPTLTLTLTLENDLFLCFSSAYFHMSYMIIAAKLHPIVTWIC